MRTHERYQDESADQYRQGPSDPWEGSDNDPQWQTDMIQAHTGALEDRADMESIAQYTATQPGDRPYVNPAQTDYAQVRQENDNIRAVHASRGAVLGYDGPRIDSQFDDNGGF